MKYRIYYDNGNTYDGEIQNAPAFGVMCIVEDSKKHGRLIVSNGDYYVYIVEEECWRSADFIGMVDYLQRPGWKKVLIGRLVDDQTFNRIFQMADKDPDFPPRTAYGFFESKER